MTQILADIINWQSTPIERQFGYPIFNSYARETMISKTGMI